MKLSKTKKIILLGLIVGILAAIITPIVILNANQNKNNVEKINENKNNVEKIDLLKNSNIFDGNGSTIFQDSFKNLWTMSDSITKDVNGTKKTIHTKLQVLKANQNKDGYVDTGWTNDDSNNGEVLLKNSNIINGKNGIIFQDQFKNLWAMSKYSNLQVLKANQNKDGYVTTGWDSNNSGSATGLLKGSNITNGWGGKIFQDKFKNLWSIGDRTGLQVLKANQNKDGYVTTGWNSNNSSLATGLLKGSKISEGYGGIIFQDQFKNLWSKGTKSKLQVLKANSQKNTYDETIGWKSDINSGLLLNSNINKTTNWVGKILQDEFKNLWTMADSKLQVLRANQNKDDYVTTGWDSNNSSSATWLLKGSNITHGWDGVIFKDSFKNLWSMGTKTKLQVLRANQNKDDYVTTSWKSDTDSGLTKNSNITNGRYGTIFQDSFKNLWAMGRYTKLQVLKANANKDGYDEATGWTSVNNVGLLKNSSINQGQGGTIFQDQFKNLWVTGFQELRYVNKVLKVIYPKLQVLRANENKSAYVDSWEKPID